MTSEIFAVGTSLGKNGIFGFILDEELPGSTDPLRVGPTKYWLGQEEYDRRVQASLYDTEFRARKSVFCFENRILCLGSGIHASDTSTNHPVCTTLFQRVLKAEDKARLKFPDERRNTDGRADWLIDRNGEGYYIASGNDPLVFSRAHRNLPYFGFYSPKNPERHDEIILNEGDTELAIFNHGPAPADKGYEYCMVMRAKTDDVMKDFATKMAKPETAYYRILQRDKDAHVVIDRESHTTGYVIFEEKKTLPSEGVIVESDKPCVVMSQSVGTDVLQLSVCDPEIAGDPWNVATPTTVTLRLRGHWQADATAKKVQTQRSGADTILRVSCVDLLPVMVELSRSPD